MCCRKSCQSLSAEASDFTTELRVAEVCAIFARERVGDGCQNTVLGHARSRHSFGSPLALGQILPGFQAQVLAPGGNPYVVLPGVIAGAHVVGPQDDGVIQHRA